MAASKALGKPEPLSRAPSVAPSESASTLADVPAGRASVASIKAMGAAEEKGRVAREAQIREKREKAQRSLQFKARQAKIITFNQQLEPMMPSSVDFERRELLRGGVERSGINLGELSTKSQARLRLPQKTK